MRIAAAIFPTAETMNPVEFATTAEARLRIDLVPGALPHPDQPPLTVGWLPGCTSAAGLRPHIRPVRRPRRLCCGDVDDQAGDGDLPGRPARPNPYRQGGRQRRRTVGRADDFRDRLRVEPGGDGPARHPLRRPPRDPARPDPGDEGFTSGWDEVRRACDDTGRDSHRTRPSSPRSPRQA